jgi:hypothetical protein
LTVTVKSQRAVLPAASIAVQFTWVVPFANVDPEGGEHATDAPEQLSVVVAL